MKRIWNFRRVINASVLGNAEVCERADIYGDALISEYAKIFGYANIYGNAKIDEFALVFDYADVYGGAYITDCAQIKDTLVCQSNLISVKVAETSILGLNFHHNKATDIDLTNASVKDSKFQDCKLNCILIEGLKSINNKEIDNETFNPQQDNEDIEPDW